MWSFFSKLAVRVHRPGVKIAMAWPRRSQAWKRDDVSKLLKTLSMKKVTVGDPAHEGRSRWLLVSNDQQIVDGLAHWPPAFRVDARALPMDRM